MMSPFTLGQTLQGYYNSIEKKITQNTINAYIGNLSRIYDALDIERNSDIIFTDKLSELIQYIDEKHTNASSRKTNFASLVILAKAKKIDDKIISLLQTEMKKGIDKYNEETKDKIENGVLPSIDFEKIKLELKERVDMIDLTKRRVDKKGKNTLRDWVIFNIYTLHPPTRSDHGAMRYKKDNEDEDDKFNYIDMTNDHFIYNNYKTKKNYGRVVVPFGLGFKDSVEPYLKFIGDGNFLFTLKKGHPYSDTYYGVTVKEIFGFGCSTLRKIYLTQKYSKIYELLEDLDKDAVAMMNSVDVIRLNYLHKVKELVSEDLPKN